MFQGSMTDARGAGGRGGGGKSWLYNQVECQRTNMSCMGHLNGVVLHPGPVTGFLQRDWHCEEGKDMVNRLKMSNQFLYS